MKFTFNHFNFNVIDLEKSMKFYEEALGFKEVRRKEAEDGSFVLVFLGDEETNFSLELTWMKGRTEPYDLGEQEYHLAIATDNYEEAFKKHEKMGCIEYINETMGIYFIVDPDGYWIEVVRKK
ncbi:MAG TPA: lactoylglutathione lyase [Clostridiales bacterium]|nr:lactoylglutathione lyase [Clostridiales bacterium]HCS10179.1 lactoylglutathione lyase [Clostridiales bacterium]